MKNITIIKIPPYFQESDCLEGRYKVHPEGFTKLAEDVAKAMGDGWEVKHDRATLADYIRSIQKDHYVIDLTFPSGHVDEAEAIKPKLNISGSFWHPTEKKYIWDNVNYKLRRQGRDEINVTATRGSKVIAKEIQRRLFPLYQEKMDSAIANHKIHKEAEEKRKTLLTEIAQMLGTKPYSHNSDCCSKLLDNGYVEVQANSGSVDLKLRSVKPYQAKAIIEILKG